MFFNHLFSIFHKKNKTQEKTSVKEPIRSLEGGLGVDDRHNNKTPGNTSYIGSSTSNNDSNATSETQSISHVSNNEIVVSTPAPLPQVEFQESRKLLQLDFFGSDTQEQSIATFPKFDYLLQPPPKELNCSSSIKKSRKSSSTLRHRISLYRPSSKTVKRSLSSPDIYNKQ